MRRFNSRLERLERELCSIPEAERLERERDLEFGEAIRWLYANKCVWASEAMAQGLTLPTRFRLETMEDLLNAERAYHAWLLGDRLFYGSDERWVREELDALARLGVDEATAREWASRFEFMELGAHE